MSSYGVMRGLHFQRPPFTQSKLVRCVKDFADDADFSSLLFVCPTDFTEFHSFLPYAGWDFADNADDADFFCISSITHHDFQI